MRVGFVIPYLRTPSGWRTACLGIVKALAVHAGVEPMLFVGRADHKAAQEAFPDAEIVCLPEIQDMRISSPRFWLKLAATFLTIAFMRNRLLDIIHSLDAYSTGLVGFWLAKKAGKPHVITALGTYAVIWHKYPLDNFFYRRILRHASCICPMSNGTLQMMKKYYSGILAKRTVAVILMGTDYCTAIPRDVALSHTPASPPIILSVGEVKPRKGHHISIQAFGLVQKRFPETRYIIIGAQNQMSYVASLQKMMSENGITGVEFLGVVSNDKLKEYYQSASVFVLASQCINDNFEGFGLVFIEAGAYGLPVVGTRAGGVPDAIKHGETGFVVKPDDVKAMADAVCALLSNPALSKKMGTANRRWAETLTWERFADAQSAVYRNVISHSR